MLFRPANEPFEPQDTLTERCRSSAQEDLTTMNMREQIQTPSKDVIVDWRSFFTWIVTGALFYALISGALIRWLPFGVYVQYSVIIHAVVGTATLLPILFLIVLHWQRRRSAVSGIAAVISLSAAILLVICLATGLLVVIAASTSGKVDEISRALHWLSGIALGLAISVHLIPIFMRYGSIQPTLRRPARKRFLAASAAVIVVLLGATQILASRAWIEPQFQAFSDDYAWRFGADRPFWPSRADTSGAQWQTDLNRDLTAILDGAELAALQERIDAGSNGASGPIGTIEHALAQIDIADAKRAQLNGVLNSLPGKLAATGAVNPNALIGAASCGSAGCHEQIYEEWLPSAHGFSATDIIFREVQELLAEARHPADTRSCAGCHDPVALLSGARNGTSISGDELVIYEGISCLVCHDIIETDSEGNGGYVMQVPHRYLFADSNAALGQFLNRFLIRGYPQHHKNSFARPLYRDSEFCAACHKQVPADAVDTPVGFAQEQNEYDSWRQGRWYHEDRPDLTIECRECHMPLVDSDDPASGDDTDSYRNSGDRKHRSHRALASNMYIPVVQDLAGGKEQADQTIAWLRGEIEIPEIQDKWTTGPVIDIRIVAPDQIAPGELINLTLHLHNNKTGHDFPAGPLDVLESWIELTVEDNLGRVLMQLGREGATRPTIDAPVVYKADWYDRQGLPVERHNLWDVVGASYKHFLESGTGEHVDIPFRCPTIARPRISDSVSEKGPGERKSDVVFSVDNDQITQLTVTARLLYRKASPEFLTRVFSLQQSVEAPVIELNKVQHTIDVKSE